MKGASLLRRKPLQKKEPDKSSELKIETVLFSFKTSPVLIIDIFLFTRGV